MNFTRTMMAVAISSCCAAGAAQAQDGITWKASAFGTLGAVHTSEKNADFTATFDQPNGPGHTRDWDFGTDSKLGGQLDATFNPQFSATVQALARRNYNETWSPRVMMGFLKWQAAPEWAFRVGRMPYPAFLISDSRNVGYSLTPIRPVEDLYGPFFPQGFNGADATWKTTAGPLALKTEAFLGEDKLHLPGDITVKFPRVWGLNLTAETGDWTWRANYVNFSITPRSPLLDTTFAGVSGGFPAGALGTGSPAIPAAPDLTHKYYGSSMPVSYGNIDLNYDPGDWFVTSELAMNTAVSFFPRRYFGYLTGGFRVNSFTPYLTVSAVKAKKPASTANPVVDQILGGFAAQGQKTLSSGVRWDVVKNIDLKAQFDHVRTDAGSHGQLTNVQPGFKPGSSYNVISVAMDFVY